MSATLQVETVLEHEDAASGIPRKPEELDVGDSDERSGDLDSPLLNQGLPHQQQPAHLPKYAIETATESPQRVSPTNAIPDVRYVLSGQPTGWAAMAEVVRKYDEDKVQDTKEDIDTLLVFAGLFSAVLTAFLIESYQRLSPQTDSQMLAVLQQIALQTATYHIGNDLLNSTSPPPINLTSASPQPFQPSDADIRVNVLWFASLIFSLITASFGMLVKQWLREYLAVEYPSPQARLRVRHFRYPQILKWNVFEIAAVLPLLQQLALALFFIGLCYFTASVHESVGYTSLPLVVGWAFCFCTVTVMPLFFPRCPYKTTLLKRILRSVHVQCIKGMEVTLNWLFLCDPNALGEVHLPGYERGLAWPNRVFKSLRKHRLECDEGQAMINEEADLNLLIGVDTLQVNDDLLGTTIAESLYQVQPDFHKVIDFILRLLKHRLPQTYAPVLSRSAFTETGVAPIDLRPLSRNARNAIVDMLIHYSDILFTQNLPTPADYGQNPYIFHNLMAFYILFSPARYPLPATAVNALAGFVQQNGPDIYRTLAQRCLSDVWPQLNSDSPLDLLIRGISHVLEDLDAGLAFSVRCFESMMQGFIENVNAPSSRYSNDDTDPPLPDLSTILPRTVDSSLEQWSYLSQLLPDRSIVAEAANFLVLMVCRALRHMQLASVRSANVEGSAIGHNLNESVQDVGYPPGLTDAIIGVWTFCDLCISSPRHYDLPGSLQLCTGECLLMRASTLAMVESLVRLRPRLIIDLGLYKSERHTYGLWVTILNDDPLVKLKLKNLIWAVSTLSQLEQGNCSVDERRPSYPLTSSVSPISVLSICYIVLHMVNLPNALPHKTLLQSLFQGLTLLAHRTLDLSYSLVAEPYEGSPNQPLDTISDRMDFAHPSLDNAAQDGKTLVLLCLRLIQENDILSALLEKIGSRSIDSSKFILRPHIRCMTYYVWARDFKRVQCHRGFVRGDARPNVLRYDFEAGERRR